MPHFKAGSADAMLRPNTINCEPAVAGSDRPSNQNLAACCRRPASSKSIVLGGAVPAAFHFDKLPAQGVQFADRTGLHTAKSLFTSPQLNACLRGGQSVTQFFFPRSRNFSAVASGMAGSTFAMLPVFHHHPSTMDRHAVFRRGQTSISTGLENMAVSPPNFGAKTLLSSGIVVSRR